MLVNRMGRDPKIKLLVIVSVSFIIFAVHAAGCSGTAKVSNTSGNIAAIINSSLDSQAIVNNSNIDNSSILVNNSSGKATNASLLSGNDSRIRLSADDAMAIALDYAQNHFEGFKTLNMTLSNEKLLDHGSDGVEYYFSWTEMLSGAYSLNSTIVTVNATNGCINKYYESYGPTPVEVNPYISKDQAIAIATGTDYFKNYRPTSVEATLYTGYGSRPLRLIWRVDITCNFNVTDSTTGMAIPDHRGGQVTVDAMTGEVVDVNPCR